LTSKRQFYSSRSGLTPLDFAIEKLEADPENELRTEMVQLLQKHGVLLLLLLLLLLLPHAIHQLKFTLPSDALQGRTTLHGCASNNDVEGARNLLKPGLDVDQMSRFQRNAACLARSCACRIKLGL
jgi:ankyrin repeat protein